MGSCHGIVAFLPIHWADFAVLLEVLESIDDAEAFFDGAAKGHVVDDLMLYDAFFVDEEESTVGDHFTFDSEVAFVVVDVFTCEDIVVVGDGFVGVCDDGVGNALDATFVFGCLQPCPVREFGVGGAANDLYVTAFEFSDFLLEAVQFGRADKGEVLGVEEEDDVFFIDVLLEAEVLNDVFSLHGFGCEGRGGFSDEY